MLIRREPVPSAPPSFHVLLPLRILLREWEGSEASEGRSHALSLLAAVKFPA